jgi:hypothetical protein
MPWRHPRVSLGLGNVPQAIADGVFYAEWSPIVEVKSPKMQPHDVIAPHD